MTPSLGRILQRKGSSFQPPSQSLLALVSDASEESRALSRIDPSYFPLFHKQLFEPPPFASRFLKGYSDAIGIVRAPSSDTSSAPPGRGRGAKGRSLHTDGRFHRRALRSQQSACGRQYTR